MRILRASLGLIALATFLTAPCSGAETPSSVLVSSDPWVGTYSLQWMAGGSAAKGSGPTRAVLRKAPDANPATVMPNEGADLERWSLTNNDGVDDRSVLRRFTPREYRDLNWTALHAAGGIECLSGSSVFICRTKPGALVSFGEKDSHGREISLTRTGKFGVALHAGGFELESVADVAVKRKPGRKARDPLAITMEEIEGERAEKVSACLSAAINSNTMGACVSAELQAQDIRLNEVYRAVMKQLGHAGRLELRSDERAWIRERDAGCKEDLTGGTGDMFEWPNCLLNETIRRRLVLESMVTDRK